MAEPQPKLRRRLTMGRLALVSLFIVPPAAVGGCFFLMSRLDESMRQASEQREEQRIAMQVAEVEAKRSTYIEFYDLQHGTDEKLARLKPLPGLELVILHQTDVTDEGMRHLISQPNLKHLVLNTVPIGDNGLAYIAQMGAQLESLHVDNTFVTDEGLVHLGKLPSLHSLKLSSGDDPIFTDVALENLSGLVQLRKLRLEGDWFTDAGIERLRQALPDCEITIQRRKRQP